jgi:hypothetical protein
MFEIQHASPRVGSVIRTTKQDMIKGTCGKTSALRSVSSRLISAA